MAKQIHVAAALIERGDQVLLALRPSDKHQGGLWEFPGGKVEPGEPVFDALRRELDEELGIVIEAAKPLIQIPYHYPDKSVFLDVYRCSEFSGEPYGREGQQVRWVARSELGNYQFPAANRPILQAAMLPQQLLITRPLGESVTDAELTELVTQVATAQQRWQHQRVLVRQPALDESQLSQLFLALRKALPDTVLLGLNAAPDLATQLAADWWHLTSQRLMEADSSQIQAVGLAIGASCHSAAQLAKAAELKADYALLSPVLATESHPGADTLGWQNFELLVREAQLPVYALGGLNPQHLEQAQSLGAQGIAAIRGWLD